jgi:ribonuclease R
MSIPACSRAPSPRDRPALSIAAEPCHGAFMTKRRAPSASPAAARGLPTREQVLDFIANAQTKVGKREIARAFSLKGGDRLALKELLAGMTADGDLAGNRKALAQPGKLPAVTVYDIVARDADGDLLAEPVEAPADGGRRLRVLVLEPAGKHERGALGVLGLGDRILARREASADGRVAVTPLKRLPKEKSKAVGVLRIDARGHGRIEPVDKRERNTWRVDKDRLGTARDGDLVRFDVARSRSFATEAVIVDVIGDAEDPRQISLIAIHAHGIPDAFPARVLAELDGLPHLSQGRFEDWRDLPLLTIDPVDARDHDDAVHAAPDPDPANPGGWIVTVAIADVSYYVRPGTALDREARLRGNSVYFPDRVVPMLPERISNDLCSLRELEDRPALAARMVFDKAGTKRRHSFHRILMHSVAKLSYQQAQAAIDGTPDAKTAPLIEAVLRPLWAAYGALSAARDRRSPLDLDLPERRVLLDAAGRVKDVIVPERLAAHRLIEEFMIQANVAAAEQLEARKSRCVYRIHEPPSREKLDALRQFLATVGLALPPAGNLRPSHFNQVLTQAKALPVADLINEVVLRSQSQAVYSPENLGHFGLHLTRYAHFTSPIRRYADLLVHRALVRALDLGPGGIDEPALADLDRTSELISQAERRAMMAERDTIDRMIAHHLADRVGSTFQARISGVTGAGLFVRLKETGADGFIPISTLGDEYYRWNEAAHALIGERSRAGYRLGDVVEVKLVEVVPLAGGLRFEMRSPAKTGLAAGVPTGLRGQRRQRGKAQGTFRRRR